MALFSTYRVHIDHALDSSLFRSQTVNYPQQYNVERYQVRLVNLKKEGLGRALYEGDHSNEILVTKWSNGMKNGEGFIYDKDTKRIVRRMTFQDNVVSQEVIINSADATFGIIDSVDGSRWEGEIVNGEACGVGSIYNSQNELIYKGFYIDNAREGYGESYYPGTDKVLAYKGLWCRNARHGEGEIYDQEGKLCVKGLFLEDQIVQVDVVISSFLDIDSLSTLTETIVISDNTLEELERMDLSECRKLRTLKIGDHCCKNVRLFCMSHLRELEHIEIGRYSFTSLTEPDIPDDIQSRIADENRQFEVTYCPRLESIKIGCCSFYEFRYFILEVVPYLKEFLLTPENVGIPDAPGHNFFGCDELFLVGNLDGLSNLTTVVLGNFAFRYAQRVELDNMPMLRELVLGDESVNFCTALSITNLPRLKTWKIYGKSMNGCVDLKMTDLPLLDTIEYTPLVPNYSILMNLKKPSLENVSSRVQEFVNKYIH